MKSNEDECWLWTGGLDSSGYGTFAPGARLLQMFKRDGQPAKQIAAHRWVYLTEIGTIPEGLQIDHLCRTRHCVNPKHLEAVTQRENIQRGLLSEVQRTRAQAQTHCIRGHELSGDNVRYHNGGHRYCRTCTNMLAMRRYYLKKGR